MDPLPGFPYGLWLDYDIGGFEDIIMANPSYRTNQFHYSHAQPESLYATVTIGASGAPTVSASTAMGITSITRSSAGRYVIALSHAYNNLLGVRATINSGSSAPASPSLYVAADASSTRSAPAVTVVFNAAGTPTDPASGEILLLEVILQKSAVKY